MNRQEASNYQAFEVLLHGTEDAPVDPPSAAVFYLTDQSGTSIVSAGTATITAQGNDQLVSYRPTSAQLSNKTRVNWQFHISWTNPTREQWTPVESARLDENLA